MFDHWKPDGETVTHAGMEMSPEMQFIIPPPPEIGAIQTAFTNVGLKAPMTTTKRMIYSVLVFAVCLIAAGLICWFAMEPEPGEVLNIALISIGIAVVPGLITFFLVSSPFEVSYVGDRGAALFQYNDPEEPPKRSDVLIFADAEDIKTAETRHYTNGVYTGTNYSYSWHDISGNAIMTLAGNYNGENGVPKNVQDRYFFTLMCENIYNKVRIQKLADDFEKNGFVSFNIAKGKVVNVGDGYLEFDFNGKVDRVPSEDIKNLSIDSGTFRIDTKDARFFGSKGKFRFQYGQMGNAQLFLYALSDLAGFEFN